MTTGRQRCLKAAALSGLIALLCSCPRAGRPRSPGGDRSALAGAAALAALEAGRLPGVFHRVAPGETLVSISQKYRVSAQWLAEINGQDPGAALRPGEDLFVPGVRAPRPPPVAQPADRIGLAWPLAGVITSPFGPRRGRQHEGLDIAAPTGTPVRAAADGVVMVSRRLGKYGKVVLVRHKGRVVTLYAHNRTNLVRVGERVRAGQVIARVGRTGNATGPHVHFEVRVEGRPRNPMSFLRPGAAP